MSKGPRITSAFHAELQTVYTIETIREKVTSGEWSEAFLGVSTWLCPVEHCRTAKLSLKKGSITPWHFARITYDHHPTCPLALTPPDTSEPEKTRRQKSGEVVIDIQYLLRRPEINAKGCFGEANGEVIPHSYRPSRPGVAIAGPKRIRSLKALRSWLLETDKLETLDYPFIGVHTPIETARKVTQGTHCLLVGVVSQVSLETETPDRPASTRLVLRQWNQPTCIVVFVHESLHARLKQGQFVVIRAVNIKNEKDWPSVIYRAEWRGQLRQEFVAY